MPCMWALPAKYFSSIQQVCISITSKKAMVGGGRETSETNVNKLTDNSNQKAKRQQQQQNPFSIKSAFDFWLKIWEGSRINTAYLMFLCKFHNFNGLIFSAKFILIKWMQTKRKGNTALAYVCGLGIFRLEYMHCCRYFIRAHDSKFRWFSFRKLWRVCRVREKKIEWKIKRNHG